MCREIESRRGSHKNRSLTVSLMSTYVLRLKKYLKEFATFSRRKRPLKKHFFKPFSRLAFFCQQTPLMCRVIRKQGDTLSLQKSPKMCPKAIFCPNQNITFTLLKSCSKIGLLLKFPKKLVENKQ
jgi:hypothetical protein